MSKKSASEVKSGKDEQTKQPSNPPLNISGHGIQQMRAETDTLKSRLIVLEHDKARLEDLVAGYEDSTSWRVTAPLRAVRKLANALIGARGAESIATHGHLRRGLRRTIPFEIAVVRDLALADRGWTATGTSPELAISFRAEALPPGRYLLSLRCRHVGAARRLAPSSRGRT